MSVEQLLDILSSKPDYLSTPEEELPFVVKRVKVPSSPLSKLKFEPNKVSRIVFEFDSFYEAALWRLKNKRINHRLYTGEIREGKTTIAIAHALRFTDLKRSLIKGAKKIPDFRISFDPKIGSNLLLGQFITLRSQILFSKFKRYEEILVDEYELCVNRMRSSSGQNLDARNTLDAGGFRYNPISGICPSIGSIDKEISSTKKQWNVIAEYISHRKKQVEVIVKYNVHSRDNYEYRWVTFIEMIVEWCPPELYHQAAELKRRMIETVEGLKSKKKHYAEEVESLRDEQKQEEDRRAREIIHLWEEGKITKHECAFRIYNEVRSSYDYVAEQLKPCSWRTAKKLVRMKEEEFEEGVISEENIREIIG